MFSIGGAGIAYYILATPDPWIEWDGVDIVIKDDDASPSRDILDITLHYQLLQPCDRLRLTTPLSLVQITGPGVTKVIRLPVLPTSELTTIIGPAKARLRIYLNDTLDQGQPHEITLSLACLLSADGGSIKAAKVAPVVKTFTP